MITVTENEAANRFAELLAAAAAGESVTITRAGKPLAVLSAAEDDEESLAARQSEAIRRMIEHARRAPFHATREEIEAWKNEGRA